MGRNGEESSEPKASNHFTCSPKTWGGGPSLHLTFQRKNSQHAGDGSRDPDLPTIPDAMNPRTSVMDTRDTKVNKTTLRSSAVSESKPALPGCFASILDA